MFRDMPGLLFIADGVPADLIRPGEPRLARQVEDGTVASGATARRMALARRLLRPTTA